MLFKTIHNLSGMVWPLVERSILYLELRPRLSKGLLIFILFSFFVTGLRIADAPKESASMFSLSSSKSDFDDYFQASILFSSGAKDPYRIHNLSKAQKILKESKGSMAGLMQSLALLKGVGSYLYPPFTAFLLEPLQSLNYVASAIVYLLVSTLCFGAWIYVSFRFAKNSGATHGRALSLLLVLTFMLIGFLNGNAANGNIGFVLIFLCGAGLIFSFSSTLYLEFLGGFLVGVAGVMKITPIFLAGILFAGRRMVALLGFVCGIFFAIMIPSLSYGVDQNISYLGDWYFLVVESFQDIVFVRSWMNNQSIGGMIGRYFLQGQEVKQAAYSLPIMVLSDLTLQARVLFFANIVKTINMSLFFVLFVASVFLFFRDGWRNAFLSFVGKDKKKVEILDTQMLRLCLMVVIASLLMSGVSWYHTWGILIICLYPWWLRLNRDGMATRFTYGFFFFLFVFGFLYQIFPSGLKDFLSMYSIYTIGMLIFFIWLSIDYFKNNKLTKHE